MDQGRQEFGPPVMFAMAGGMDMMQAGPAMAMTRSVPGPPAPGPPAVSALKKPTRVRKLFPETWLWKVGNASADGVAEFNDTVPDTITSWVATAFAVHPDSGFGLSESAANLKTFIPFFVSLHLPYSVVRGEKVIIQANVFNYSPMPLFAYVMLKRNPDYDNIHITSWWTSSYPADVARFVRIEPNSAAAVYFPIIPRKIGKIDLSVQSQSLFAADAIKKQLLVKPEGTPQEYNMPVLVDIKKSSLPGVREAGFAANVPIVYPLDTVDGSQRVRVTVIGDLMGPSVNGLDELLKMPYGCGEQNMLNFAPNIFITKYLEATNNIDEAILEKSKGFMVKGYQKELTYQHTDGSFSAFGNSDPSGSMWLSAFVLKSFVQAKPYIFIDDNVIHKTIEWIIKYQNENGTFQEPGKVLHKEMQGGSTAGERALTSFVLAALLEARSIEGVNANISNAVAKATAFLEQDIAAITDVYELAIASYVLTLAGSPKAAEVRTKLNAIATEENGMKYWTKDKSAAAPVATNPWERRKGTGKALNIELTAYALLALAENGDQNDGLLVLKWLTSQRNPNGGYSSTQDTVLALQALAEMAAMVYSKDFNMTLKISGPPGSGVSEQFTVDPNNALVLQTRELPNDIGEVNIEAEGHGLSLVEVAAFYNIMKDNMDPSFNLKVTLLEESLNDFKVQVCTSWLKEGASAMAVIEIGIPSGFSADKSSVSSHPLLKRVEDGDRKVVLYLDEIDKKEVCFVTSMERVGLVAAAQPVPVKVYDYYEPTDQITTFYVPEALRNSDVCDVCGAECRFCTNDKTPWWRG